MKTFLFLAATLILTLGALTTVGVAQTATPPSTGGTAVDNVARNGNLRAAGLISKEAAVRLSEDQKLHARIDGLTGGTGGDGLSDADVVQLIKKYAVELNGKALVDLKARLAAAESELKTLKAQTPITPKEVADALVANHLPAIRGPEGPRGLQGLEGDPGPKGDRGEKGDRGNQGPEGPQGVPGRDGVDGAPGRDGKDADPRILSKAIFLIADRHPKESRQQGLLWEEGFVNGVACQELSVSEKILFEMLHIKFTSGSGEFDKDEAAKWLRNRLPPAAELPQQPEALVNQLIGKL